MMTTMMRTWMTMMETCLMKSWIRYRTVSIRVVYIDCVSGVCVVLRWPWFWLIDDQWSLNVYVCSFCLEVSLQMAVLQTLI